MDAANYNGAPGACGYDEPDVTFEYDEDDAADERLDREREEER